MRARPVPLLLAVLALAVVAVVALLIAPFAGLLPFDVRDTRYYEVLYDDEATAGDVVDVAEAPEQVGVLDDGTEVWLYGIHDQEGGEAQKAAVQVRRRGAEPVQRLVPPMLDVVVAGDRAVLHSSDGPVSTVEADGTVRRIASTVTGLDGPVGPDDVLVGNVEQTLLYRPSDGTVREVPRTGVQPQTIPATAVVGGRVWFAGTELDEPGLTRVRWTEDGRSWRSVAYRSTGPLAVVGSPDGQTMALADVDAPDDGPVRTDSLHLVRPDGSVRAVAPPLEELGESSAAWTPDGRALLGNGDQGWWRLDGGSWTRLDVPDDVWTLSPAGERLYAFGTRGVADAAWVSDDAGESWAELGRQE